MSQDCRNVRLRDRREDVDFDQLQALCEQAAFWARDRRRADLEIAIANSNPVITAWDDDLMMGFARATSDGVYRATIWDVVVHPDYQGGGIGRKLVETILSHPQIARVERVYLMTTNQQRFYEKIGFEPNGTTTMVLHYKSLDMPSGGMMPEVECDIGHL
ncbi:GNAT family N-acetyltransferase [filamentous cyanobacterium LEGE 11480]|uniref:GNAT family N-acetyltransferase n=1 Tax=Romeriopsis navalis LEGE 11480 TaxID=2777977 RepID=A0A928VU32_9CYAN|nr:GNAT family N-acetyltransferase [Romeriopsis navalis]MBE9032249.1 GNAT family N-acetyltransferase [Romeriopsis navalis LEGE 11480]